MSGSVNTHQSTATTVQEAALGVAIDRSAKPIRPGQHRRQPAPPRARSSDDPSRADGFRNSCSRRAFCFRPGVPGTLRSHLNAVVECEHG
jgi:hypothetical protein